MHSFNLFKPPPVYQVAVMDQLTPLLDLERFPYVPYCAHEKGAMYRLPLAKALAYRYIQLNPVHAHYWLVVDDDSEVISDPISSTMKKIIDGDVPEPNFILLNPATGRAHHYYALARPVPKYDHNHIKAHRYLAAIEAAIIFQLGADARYTGLIAKNPHHSSWRKLDLRSQPYTLTELEGRLDLDGPSKSEQRGEQLAEAEARGESRNCILFDRLRFHAYPLAKTYREDASYEQWHRYLSSVAERLNDFSKPIYANEIGHIVKSVASWTYFKYQGVLSEEQFSSLQSWRGAKGGRISARVREEKAAAEGVTMSEKMKEVRAKRPTIGKPWEAMGISRAAYYRRKKQGQLVTQK